MQNNCRRRILVRTCIKIAYLRKSTPRCSRKHIFANRYAIMFNKNPFFRLGCASGCLLVASGPPSGLAKNVGNMCIISTWPPLVARFNFLLLQSPCIFTIFYFLPLHFTFFFNSISFLPFAFVELCSSLL